MKKFLIIYFMFNIMPAFSLCSLDSNESVCALPNSQQQSSLLFQKEGSQINNTQKLLQPNVNIESNIQNANKNLQRNSNCMFGTCLNDLKNTQESSFK